MTETEWLEGALLGAMLDSIAESASDRKLRLLACAFCRRVSEHLWTTSSVPAVEVAERYADEGGIPAVLETAQNAVVEKLELYLAEPVYDASYWACERDMKVAVSRCAGYAANCSTKPYDDRSERDKKRVDELRQQARLCADIFCNPFRPVALDLDWRTDTVLSLARQMYESRDFSAMPILADALQDAGCDNDDILNHCRDANGVHVRGCWVVDLVLGQS